MAGDRAADPEGLDRAGDGGRRAGGGHWRAHQVPLSGVRTNEQHLRQLEDWLRSYRPEDLFDADGRPVPELLELAPSGSARRMGSNPHANGGLLARDLELPKVREHAVKVSAPGAEDAEATKVLGGFLRDVFGANAPTRTSGCSARTRPSRTG